MTVVRAQIRRREVGYRTSQIVRKLRQSALAPEARSDLQLDGVDAIVRVAPIRRDDVSAAVPGILDAPTR